MSAAWHERTAADEADVACVTARGERDGRVAVVTGASRGAGRGIALVLGERGATVYVTGRSATGAPSGESRQGTIDDTAAAVTRRGGTGVAVRCDHTVDSDVAALLERIEDAHGRLDLLVNNAWGGYERPAGQRDAPFFDTPFWQQPMWRWDGMFTAGVRAHYLTASLAVPLLLRSQSRPRLIISTVAWAYGAFLGNVLYDAAKAATSRIAFGMAQDLRPHGIAALAIAPGHLGLNETTEYLGRAVTTLAADPDVIAKTGRTLTVGDLAREYGFTDTDGTQPKPFRLEDGTFPDLSQPPNAE
jgi:NAD(P)-dependent dehydrogenase (short-subunit alcohol dehydrogenase family)